MPPTNSKQKKHKRTTTRPTASGPVPAAEQKLDTSQAAPTPDAPVDARYAATTWGTVGGTVDLEMPSGQLALVRRVGVEGLMKAGVLHNVDSLSAIVNEKHIKRVKGKGIDEVDVGKLLKDSKSLDEIMHTVDRVVCHVVVQPPIAMAPNDVTNRKQGVIYADTVELTDKMYIFNFVVGGTRDLETFRGQLDESVGAVDDVEGVPEDAE